MNQAPLDLTTLLQVPQVEAEYGFDISPHGDMLAFSWNPTGIWEIYLQPLDNSFPPRQLTNGPGSKFAPRWSPDGKRLIYAVDMQGGEEFDLFVYNVEDGTHTNLTPGTPFTIRARSSWSPCGQWIAFISDLSNRFDTYIMPSTGGEAQLLLSLPYPDWKAHWSPDGRWLMVISETQGQDYGAFIVPVGGGEPRQIEIDGKPACIKDASWSPDGSRIAFASNEDEFFNVGVFELNSGRVDWLTGGTGDKEYPAWSPDGKRLAYIHSDGPVTGLAVVDQAGSIETYLVAPGVHYPPRFTPDGAQLVFVFDNPAHPRDFWALSLEAGVFRQITQSLLKELDRGRFTMPELVTYPGLDGESVPALLYRPPSTHGLVPAVLHIHGGPNWLAQVTWHPVIQHMVSRGWAVLAPNYRGSTGYGREWQTANRFDMGGVGADDVVAGADYLIDQNIAHPGRIALTGNSWGGYLTMTILTQHPDRWAAGSAGVPFLNWFTGHENSREDLKHWDRENFGRPEENYELWYERSPYFFLDRIQAPVQMICGAHDPRCPASESIQAAKVLEVEGKVCDLVLYKDEGHSFLKTENVIDAAIRLTTFLAGYLE